jgi:hypothetical protein
MLRRAYRDLGHDVLLRAHVILRALIRSDLDMFLPLSFVFGLYSEGYVHILRISRNLTHCTVELSQGTPISVLSLDFILRELSLVFNKQPFLYLCYPHAVTPHSAISSPTLTGEGEVLYSPR